jgi:hypothetical protein
VKKEPLIPVGAPPDFIPTTQLKKGGVSMDLRNLPVEQGAVTGATGAAALPPVNAREQTLTNSNGDYFDEPAGTLLTK